jgi:hypothetical protein
MPEHGSPTTRKGGGAFLLGWNGAEDIRIMLPKGYIRLSDRDPKSPGVLQMMEKRDRDGNPVPFVIRWARYDSKDRSGRNGELVEAKAMLPHSGINSSMYKLAYRNVKLMNGDLVRVHIYMITHFNGKTVI